jgi:hypothetical protein
MGLVNMSQICSSCGTETERYIMKPTLQGKLVVECKVCNQPRHSAPSCVNPYSDLVLTHCHDETGKPVRVTSKRQLLEAEKRYHFKSLVATYDEANFDKAPSKPIPTDPRDRIMQQLLERNGYQDSNKNKLGALHPEILASQMRELKEKGISLDDW